MVGIKSQTTQLTGSPEGPYSPVLPFGPVKPYKWETASSSSQTIHIPCSIKQITYSWYELST